MLATSAESLLRDYIKGVNTLFKEGLATEHSYRPLLQSLFEGLLGDGHAVVNEPKRTACGAPDYVITRHHLPIAYIEAKDIGKLDFKKREIKEQLSRYRAALQTLIVTDYLDFHLFVGGEHRDSVRIALPVDASIRPSSPEEQSRFLALIDAIRVAAPEAITDPKKLASRMAGAAKLLATLIANTMALQQKEAESTNQMADLMADCKRALNLSLTAEEFADLYAQTIVYGLFIARNNDNSPTPFNRSKARDLLLPTTQLLHQLFNEIATNLDPNIAWMVDDLATLIAHTDTKAILDAYLAEKGDDDPTIHLYEDFLSAYNPKLRKRKGVYYTPLPIVRFIVRAVDDILQRDFNLPNGLADEAIIEGAQGHPAHRVEILDPATGTGTFLAEVIRVIHDRIEKQGQLGSWQGYVNEHLLPRLHGFEIMMAPYAIAHLKLNLQLQKTGFNLTESNQRLGIYLTNSLENEAGEGHRFWMTEEARQASKIQRHTPIKVLLGNPPYKRDTLDDREWIMGPLAEYKREPGGNEKLDERNPRTLNNLYVKFICLAEQFIRKNPNGGIIAFITSHDFLEGPSFRGMRWHLLDTFDSIYTIDLHGNLRKGETQTGDENVFEIMQGVCITLFVRTAKKKQGTLGELYHYDLEGKRKDKFAWLDKHHIENIPWHHLKPVTPHFLFVPRKSAHEREYKAGFAIDELCNLSLFGILTKKDQFLVCTSKQQVESRMQDLISLPESEMREKYALVDRGEWELRLAKADAGTSIDPTRIQRYLYRPFDYRFLYYSTKARGIIARPQSSAMRYMMHGSHLALITSKSQTVTRHFDHIFAHRVGLSDMNIMSGGPNMFIFPIVTQENGPQGLIAPEEGISYFNSKIYRLISSSVEEEVSPIDLFDYIYATLHCPTYRTRYNEFLRLGAPRIPYPTDASTFQQLVAHGAQLRKLHLMEETDHWPLGVTFPIPGNCRIEKVSWRDSQRGGAVHINNTQLFDGINQRVWQFLIGGQAPMANWLKARRGETLNRDDIIHYSRMAFAIGETIRLMDEIDAIWEPPSPGKRKA